MNNEKITPENKETKEDRARRVQETREAKERKEKERKDKIREKAEEKGKREEQRRKKEEEKRQRGRQELSKEKKAERERAVEAIIERSKKQGGSPLVIPEFFRRWLREQKVPEEELEKMSNREMCEKAEEIKYGKKEEPKKEEPPIKEERPTPKEEIEASKEPPKETSGTVPPEEAKRPPEEKEPSPDKVWEEIPEEEKRLYKSPEYWKEKYNQLSEAERRTYRGLTSEERGFFLSLGQEERERFPLVKEILERKRLSEEEILEMVPSARLEKLSKLSLSDLRKEIRKDFEGYLEKMEAISTQSFYSLGNEVSLRYLMYELNFLAEREREEEKRGEEIPESLDSHENLLEEFESRLAIHELNRLLITGAKIGEYGGAAGLMLLTKLDKLRDIAGVRQVERLFERAAQSILRQQGRITEKEVLKGELEEWVGDVLERLDPSLKPEERKKAVRIGRNIFVIMQRRAFYVACGEAPSGPVGSKLPVPDEIFTRSFNPREFAWNRLPIGGDDSKAYRGILEPVDIKLPDHASSGWRAGEETKNLLFTEKEWEKGVDFSLLLERVKNYDFALALQLRAIGNVIEDMITKEKDPQKKKIMEKEKKKKEKEIKKEIWKKITKYHPLAVFYLYKVVFKDDQKAQEQIKRIEGGYSEDLFGKLEKELAVWGEKSVREKNKNYLLSPSLSAEVQPLFKELREWAEGKSEALAARETPSGVQEKTQFLLDVPQGEEMPEGRCREEAVVLGKNSYSRMIGDAVIAEKIYTQLIRIISYPIDFNRILELKELVVLYSSKKDEEEIVYEFLKAWCKFVKKKWWALWLPVPDWFPVAKSEAQKYYEKTRGFAALDEAQIYNRIEDARRLFLITPEQAKRLREEVGATYLQRVVAIIRGTPAPFFFGALKRFLGSLGIKTD